MSALGEVDARLFEPALGYLDRGRGALFRVSGPLVRPFVRSRDLRAIALVAISVTLALAASAFATGYLLLWGPLAFGVTHLAFEARYLLPERHKKNRALIAILAVQALLAFEGLAVFALPLAAAAAVMVTSRATEPATRRRHRAWTLLALAGSSGIVLAAPSWSRFALLHLHNLVPLGVWLVWRGRPRSVSATVLALVASALGAVLLGAFDGVPTHTPLSDRVFSIGKVADAVAAGFSSPYRKRCLVAFAFTQALHYGLWIRVVPEEARERATPRPWVASWRAYKADAGRGFARMSVLGALLVPLAVVALGAVRARSLYVSASEFHASVEAVLVCILLMDRHRDPRPRAERDGRLAESVDPRPEGCHFGA